MYDPAMPPLNAKRPAPPPAKRFHLWLLLAAAVFLACLLFFSRKTLGLP